MKETLYHRQRAPAKRVASHWQSSSAAAGSKGRCQGKGYPAFREQFSNPELEPGKSLALTRKAVKMSTLLRSPTIAVGSVLVSCEAVLALS